MSGWDRRSFLKAGAFGSAGLALENKRRLLRSAEKPWNARPARSLRKFRDPAPTLCRMCPAQCGVVAYRDGDRVAQVKGSAGSPTNRGGLCARAYAGLERLYDEERQLRPLRRRGDRGSGQWAPISWEEALSELGARLASSAGGPILHVGQEAVLVEDLRPLFRWQELFVDRPFSGRPGPGSGARWYGAPVLGADLPRARTLFLLGIRPLDGRLEVPTAQHLVEAQRDGAAVHLFDSLQMATGSHTRWHGVVPGSEASVAWGLARLLLLWRAYDPVAFGKGLTDAPEALLAGLAAFTPEAVEASSGLPAARLTGLAEEFSRAQPAVALAPRGSPASAAAALLNHLSGSVNRPGGLVTSRGPFFVRPLRPTGTSARWLRDLASGETRADLYWIVDANPAYEAPESPRVARALADPERVGFLVAMDTHLTETARLADLFLPLATHFESWDLVEGTLTDGRSCLFLQQPVTRPTSEPGKLKDPAAGQLDLFEPRPRPLGEARSLPDTLLSLAKRRNPGTFLPASTRDYLEGLLRKSWGPGSLEALRARGIWVSEEGRGGEAPGKVSLAGAIPSRPTGGGDAGACFLVRYDPAWLPVAFSNGRWGREIQHRSEALLHPSLARRLRVGDGDRVVLRTAVGEARVPARLVQGIHPQAVALPDGFGHWAGGPAATGGPATDPSPAAPYLVSRKGFLNNPLGLERRSEASGEAFWWAGAGPGDSVRALYPFRLEEGGLQDWGPVPVEVEKA